MSNNVSMKKHYAWFINHCTPLYLDLLQVSLLINEQTGGKKKRRDGEMEGERDLWIMRSENKTCQDLDRRLSFMLAEEPIKLE